MRCTPSLYVHPSSLAANVDIEQWTTRGFQLVLRQPIDTNTFAFFADAAPTENKDEAIKLGEEWKTVVGYKPIS